MRILHIISEKPPIKSGFSRAVSRLSEELVKMGHEVDILSASECKVKVIGEIKLVYGLGNIPKYLRKDYDIVNIHGHTPTFSDRLFVKAKLSRKKVVYTLHCMANYYLKPLVTIYNNLFNQLISRFSDAVVVTSKSYYDMVRGCKRKYLIPWGVDVERFSGERIPHDGYRLLFVGQMRPYKGLKILLKAIGELDAELWIVGDGPDRMEYEAYAKSMGLDKVRFFGAVPDEELKKIYLSCDVLVLPSVSLNEAFGLVTLEAAAAKCAVIASDLLGVRDVVGKFGLLIRPNDVKNCRRALLSMKDETIRNKYVELGVEEVKKYRWSYVANKYDKIYREIIEFKESLHTRIN
ncbi:MAG: glycosyltransferase family 4 protein [Thermoproteota archaeon]|nr:glycosyltransferase family 4 protein [Candidatus Bathyarchaeota archaeon]